MQLRETAKVVLTFAALIFLVDGYCITVYSREAATPIGWGYIVGAALIQGFVLAGGALVHANRNRLFRQDETSSPLDNFRKFGIVIVILITGVGMSITLLQVALVCPEKGLPDSRGKAVCELTRADNR